MENKQKGFIEEIVLIIIGAFLLLIVINIGIDFTKSVKNSVGWVWQGKHGTSVKEFQKEEGGCVYFIDVWDKSVKTCGVYQIEKY